MYINVRFSAEGKVRKEEKGKRESGKGRFTSSRDSACSCISSGVLRIVAAHLRVSRDSKASSAAEMNLLKSWSVSYFSHAIDVFFWGGGGNTYLGVFLGCGDTLGEVEEDPPPSSSEVEAWRTLPV